MLSYLSLVLAVASTVTAKSLFSSQPVTNFSDIIRTAFPIGNGQLAALPYGSPGLEKLSLNRDSLWSGGPFENSSYIGGNPPESVASALPGIRSWIFQNGMGNMTALMGDSNNYGTYAVLGNLSIAIDGVNNSSQYNRSLDLTNGLHTTSYISNASHIESQVYCSYPDSVCVYQLSASSDLPPVSVWFDNQQSSAYLVSSFCSSASQSAGLRGTTRADIGMIYEAQARVVGNSSITSCSSGGTLSITSHSSQKTLTLVIAAGTDYDESKGTAAADYSFRGLDPHDYVEQTVTRAATRDSSSLLNNHLDDFTALSGQFSLDLPDTAGSSGIETSALADRYTINGSDPYLESLQFDYGRYLFISSSRNGSLPPNLQGKWAYSLTSTWSADYHANINLQMNHWGVDQTGLGDLQTPLWDYMVETWAPRGAETAKLLYDAPGWVVHDEMNIFGFTGMKTTNAYWADYPASAAWMMLHVADHFEYSQNTAWLISTGYPQLLKPVSQFWISQLQPDLYFNDGTHVVNPCDSPEHGTTTFGCTNWQQLLYSLFTSTLAYSDIVSDTDTNFSSALTSALSTLDKGLHIGSWGQIQEWKRDIDVKNDTHRHLSNLVGWYPGSSISSYQSGYTNSTIQSAIATTLYSRGPGIADSNAGWEKVWRAACWARLNNTSEAYYELRLTIQENMAQNLLSMYSGQSEPFQIDANFGYVGAVLSMLVVDLPLPQNVGSTIAEQRTVVLGPAIPMEWANGSVKGLRIRGGGIVDFTWDENGVVRNATVATGGSGDVRVVNVKGDVLVSDL